MIRLAGTELGLDPRDVVLAVPNYQSRIGLDQADATQYGVDSNPIFFDESYIEQDMGELAGLKPLPIIRMLRQAGRPMSPASRSQPYGPGYIPLYKEDIKVEPSRHQSTIERHKKTRQVIDKWNPLEAENRQRLNNTNPNPRSRPSAPLKNTVYDYFLDLGRTMEARKSKAFHSSSADDPMWRSSSSKFKREYAEYSKARSQTDPSEFFTDKERSSAKQMLFDYLSEVARGGKVKLEKSDLPYSATSRFPKFSNDILYEWNARRKQQMRDATLDVLDVSRSTIRGI